MTRRKTSRYSDYRIESEKILPFFEHYGIGLSITSKSYARES